MNNNEEVKHSKNNNNSNNNRKKGLKKQNDINEELIIKRVQKDFIKAYMGAYSQKEISDKELGMFMRYLKNVKPLNTSSNHYLNRLKSLCNEMKNHYSQFQRLNYILGTNLDKE